MSYFTDGLAVLKADNSKLQAALADLAHPYLLVDLNAKWVAIVLEQPDDPARPWVERHSHDFPILWFYDAEDHGWGYIIFHEGEEKASIEVNYDVGYDLWRQITDLLYSDLDPHRDLAEGVSKRVYDLVYDSDSYEQKIMDQYTYAKVGEFIVFGLSLEDIAELDDILTPDFPYNSTQQVEAFKKHLNLREMNWKNYNDLKRALEEGLL